MPTFTPSIQNMWSSGSDFLFIITIIGVAAVPAALIYCGRRAMRDSDEKTRSRVVLLSVCAPVLGYCADLASTMLPQSFHAWLQEVFHPLEILSFWLVLGAVTVSILANKSAWRIPVVPLLCYSLVVPAFLEMISLHIYYW